MTSEYRAQWLNPTTETSERRVPIGAPPRDGAAGLREVAETVGPAR